MVIPMTSETIKKANKVAYKRRVIEAGNLKEPAKLVSVEEALIEKIPLNNDPGPYLIGVGDILVMNEPVSDSNGMVRVIPRKLIVDEDGLVNIESLGRVKAED